MLSYYAIRYYIFIFAIIIFFFADYLRCRFHFERFLSRAFSSRHFDIAFLLFFY